MPENIIGLTPPPVVPAATSPKVTLTASLKSFTDAIAEGSLDIYLCGFGNTPPSVQGTGNLETAYSVDADDTGAITIELFGNDQISPAATFYCIVVKDDNGQMVAVGNYRIVGTTSIDLADIQPFDPNFDGPTELIIADVTTGMHWSFSIELKQLKVTNTGAGGIVSANPVFIALDTDLHYLLKMDNGMWSIVEVSNTVPGIRVYHLDDSVTGISESFSVSGGNLQVTP